MDEGSSMTPITTGTDRMAQREIEGVIRNERRNVAREFKGK
jgi:hypothetical protein